MKRQTTTYKITIGALMAAFAVILPQIFHFTGIPQVGSVFLPMHIPVLISGFLLGPVYGMLIGIVSPIISMLITSMPTLERLPFMIGELAVYGLVSGSMYHLFNFRSKKLGTIFSLIVSMLAGRVFYALMLCVALWVFKLECGGYMAAVSATIQGVYGIVLQIIAIPPIVYAAKKGGFIANDSKGKKTAKRK